MQPALRLDTSPLFGERRARALSLLTPAEVSRFETDPQRERFLTGRMLLRELAAELTGRELECVPVSAACPDCGREHGQPHIDGLHVSLSHVGVRTVAVASSTGPAGVDMERRDVSREREAAIREITGGNGLEHWTAVEAVLKADGRGLRVDPRAVRVDGDTATLDGIRYDLVDASDTVYVITVAIRPPAAR